MTRWKSITVTTMSLLMLLWGEPSPAVTTDSCKAKLNSKDGVVLVEAEGVSGVLRWGQEAGKEIFPLFDTTGDCVFPGDVKKCQLGAAGTRERLAPPEGCTVFLKDTGDSGTCSAYIKKCIPGRRPCPSDMTDIGDVCVDRYEASVWDSPAGVTQYGASGDNYPCSDNGQNCTNIFARTVPGVLPSAYITWFQAQQACANVGKRLPTSAEWQQAVAGTTDPGPDNGITDCNSANTFAVIVTATRSACASLAGAFDMIGNVDEWVADWVPQSPTCPGWGAFSSDVMCLSGASTTAQGPGALLRGGSYVHGTGAGPFTLYGNTLPSFSLNHIGFRCAR